VTSVSNTHALAKAGVMIRESLNASSKYGFCAITPSSGLIAQLHGNGTGVDTYTAAGAAPTWVRVTRVSGTLTCFYSSDGSSWTQMGTRSVGLTTAVYIGLAVTSHNDGTLCTATFDNVTVTGNAGLLAASITPALIEEKEQANLDVFPNPSNRGQVTVRFSLSQPQPVRLMITDLNGRQVQSTDMGMLGKGSHSHTMNTTSITAGVYLIVLKTRQSTSTARLVQP
jgi:hypothetical protein